MADKLPRTPTKGAMRRVARRRPRTGRQTWLLVLTLTMLAFGMAAACTTKSYAPRAASSAEPPGEITPPVAPQQYAATVPSSCRSMPRALIGRQFGRITYSQTLDTAAISGMPLYSKALSCEFDGPKGTYLLIALGPQTRAQFLADAHGQEFEPERLSFDDADTYELGSGNLAGRTTGGTVFEVESTLNLGKVERILRVVLRGCRSTAGRSVRC